MQCRSGLTAAIAKYGPKQSEFYSELGDAIRRRGQPGDAIPVFETALGLKQDSLAAWVGLGSAFEALARYPKAVEAFERAIAVAPSEALLWQELAQVYIKLSQRERAMEALKRSLVFDPTVPQTHQLLGTLWMEEDSARAEDFFAKLPDTASICASAHQSRYSIGATEPARRSRL
jgi:tetratricopeptide (TPR) repeat protein